MVPYLPGSPIKPIPTTSLASLPRALTRGNDASGKLNTSTGAVATTSKIILKLTSMSVAGVPVPVPANCQTSPATIKLKSQKGFNVVNGGNLAGTYTIPDFSGCGVLTPVLNLTIPGSGNTIALKLGKAKRV